MKISECTECTSFLLQNYFLIVGACASVALSHDPEEGVTVKSLQNEYLTAYHNNGHRPLGLHDVAAEEEVQLR